METLDGAAQTLSTIQPGTYVSHVTGAKAHYVLINIMYIFHRAACHSV